MTMRNEQTRYIKDKEVKFVILQKGSLNFEYFSNLAYLKDNYSLIGTFESDCFLYKRKE